MLKAMSILIVCSFFVGCTSMREFFKDATSLGQVEIIGPSPVPAAPQPSAEQVAMLQEAVNLAERGLEHAILAVERLEDKVILILCERMVATASADVGGPADPLPLPVDEESRVEVEEKIEEYQEEIGEQREDEHKWREELAKAAAKPSRRAFRVTSGLAWHYVAFGVGGLGLALAGLWRKLKGWSKMAIDIVAGVQVAREVAGPGTAARKLMNAALFSNTTQATRDKIKKVKDSDCVRARVAETREIIRSDGIEEA